MPSLVHSIARVGGNTLLSRILGFIRDLLIARIFGANAATDAFIVAFKIPNLVRRLFTEGAFAMAFVPVLNEYRVQREPEALRHLVDVTAGTLGAALVGITILGVLGAPALILAFAPGFLAHPDQYALASDLLRLTFPYLLFITLTAFAGSILNTFGRFGIPAFTPVLLNVSLILCAVFLAPHLQRPILALAWGVLIGGIAQLALQLPFLRQLHLLPRPRLMWQDPGVRKILGLLVPALLGVSVAQISLLLDTLLASFLGHGSISWLYYSDRLMEFPQGILAAALGTVILPHLSRQHAGDDPHAFSATLDWALRWALLLGLPAAIGLATLAGPLMATLFHSTVFDARDVTMASHSLIAYALGLEAFMLIKVLAPGYYARQDMRTPMRIALIALTVNMVFNLLLMFPLAHTGLALATTLAALVNATLLLRGLLRSGVFAPLPGWTARILRVSAASAAMGLMLQFARAPTPDWLALGEGTRLLHLTGWILAGILVYAATALATGIRPRELLRP